MRALRTLFAYLKPYWLPAVAAPLLMALEVAMDLAQPRMLQTIVDEGIANGDLALVIRTGAIMVGVALVGMVGGVGCTVFATIASMNMGAAIRGDVFRKVQTLSFANLDELETGSLITRLTNDVDQVQEASMMFLRILVRAPLLVAGSLIMAVLTCPNLTWLLVAISPVLILMLAIVTGKAQPMFTALQSFLDRVNTLMQENLAGVRVVKAFVRSDFEKQRFSVANDDLMASTVRASSLVAIVRPGMMLTINVGIAATIWFGGLQVQQGQMQVGQLMAFINYLMHMLMSLMMVGMMLMRVTRAEASSRRVLEVLHSEPRVQAPAQPAVLPECEGRVEFSQVGFSYDGEEAQSVLDGVSFVAEPGQTVAIVGSTGSGKSSLVHLVPRLYDVTSGSVSIDGTDVRQIEESALRRHVSVVLQEAVLFSGTIADNIRYGRPDATDEQVREAAVMAQAHEFIEKLPEGYETVLGQRGVNLSGGQKQRLSIARALVARPAVLVLDDCTSAVDMTTEAKIIAALRNWSHRCTRLVIAQRIGTVMSADKALVLDGGKIAAEGTHEELLAKSPTYQSIVRSQLDGEEVAHV